MTIRKLIVVLAALGAAPALGYDPAPGAASASQSTSSTSTSSERDEKAREYFTDLPVVDQHGERKRFFSDVLKNKLVLISFFYTS